MVFHVFLLFFRYTQNPVKTTFACISSPFSLGWKALRFVLLICILTSSLYKSYCFHKPLPSLIHFLPKDNLTWSQFSTRLQARVQRQLHVFPYLTEPGKLNIYGKRTES